MAPSSQEKEKKSRWRSMLGGHNDTRADEASHLRPGPSPKDSAYGGSERTASEQPCTRPQSAEPSETKVKKDPYTGNIVTTTVTTTTTTTTVTTGSGEHIKTESTPTAEADATATIRNSGEPTSAPTAAHVRPANRQENEVKHGHPESRHGAAPGASDPAANLINPAELDAPVPGAASAEGEGPPIPTKSNRRISREMNYQPPRPISEVPEPPVSPIGSPSQHNFSYPARTSPHQSQQPSQSEEPPQGERYHQDQKPYQGQGAHNDKQPHQEQQAYQPYPGHPTSQGQQPYSSLQTSQGQQPYSSLQTSQGQQPHSSLQTSHGQQAYPNQQTYQGERYPSNQASSPAQHIAPDGASRPGQRPGTFQNLKVAAAGIHGAGETLRGTLNSSIDRHIGHAPPEKLAAHQQVLAHGASEIESGKLYHDPAREQDRLRAKGRLGGILRKPVP
ncbi:hypothetical protein GJ744_009433 [Endocarpon pusillum]|uniref:Uncharacterized protein n=1 Tax=Endocarpon pusillum TaxID=364733 RepID=A0A8H7E4X3_9EURO|nr:hypothetical protein GJ744_009433 [Endocarpon pusillum]